MKKEKDFFFYYYVCSGLQLFFNTHVLWVFCGVFVAQQKPNGIKLKGV